MGWRCGKNGFDCRESIFLDPRDRLSVKVAFSPTTGEVVVVTLTNPSDSSPSPSSCHPSFSSDPQ